MSTVIPEGDRQTLLGDQTQTITPYTSGFHVRQLSHFTTRTRIEDGNPFVSETVRRLITESDRLE